MLQLRKQEPMQQHEQLQKQQKPRSYMKQHEKNEQLQRQEYGKQ